MILDVKFSETNQHFNSQFGEIHEVSDGGFERGYAEGYEQGNVDGYTNGYEEGYDCGYESGEALLIQSKPSRIENDVVTSIRDSAFYFGGTSTPTYVSFKNAKTIGVSSFQNCRGLKEAYFDSVTSIGKSAFYLCQGLEKLVIRTPSVCKLANAMENNKISSKTGYVYVPDNLVDSYKSATNWSAVASQIKPLSELGE